MSGYMITNSWADIELVCQNRHSEPIPMHIQEGNTPFYACPKYHEEHREPGELACNNRISLQDYMNMLEHLHKIVVKAELDDEQINLTNYTWKDRKGIEYRVLKQDGSKLTIEVYNKRAINS